MYMYIYTYIAHPESIRLHVPIKAGGPLGERVWGVEGIGYRV